MAISDLTTLDISFIIGEVIFLGLMVVNYYYEGNSLYKCKKIEIKEEKLRTWRYLLYATVISSWLISLMIFVIPSSFRVLLYIFFGLGVNYMLNISVPSWVCKRLGFGGTCNCDFYRYNDFYPMFAIGVLGNLIYLFFELTIEFALLLLLVLFILSGIFHYLLPEKELKPLKYSPELLISDIDELQEFIMTDPHKRKLVTILDAKCDFCEIQVNELNRLPQDFAKDNLRIYDLTYKENIDRMVPLTLNINEIDKLPVPTTIVFDSGMIIEQRDGVLLEQELEGLIQG